jgi:hypothetical protein
VEKIIASIRPVMIVCVCALAFSYPDFKPLHAQEPKRAQRTPSTKPKPHSKHIPQHGGIFFMALDNEHHLEGVLLKTGIFKVYLYDAYTNPLAAAKVRQASGSVQVGESESAPNIPLKVGEDSSTLEVAMGKDLKLPITITLSLRFQMSKPNIRPEVFTFHFTHFS